MLNWSAQAQRFYLDRSTTAALPIVKTWRPGLRFVDPYKPQHARSASAVLGRLLPESLSCDRQARSRLSPSRNQRRAHRPGNRASSEPPVLRPCRYGNGSSLRNRERNPVRLYKPFLPLITWHLRAPPPTSVKRSLRLASLKPRSTNYESFCIFGRSKRADQATPMPVFEISSSDPFLLIDICSTVAELQNGDGSFAIRAVELAFASVFLPLYGGSTHSTPRFRARFSMDIPAHSSGALGSVAGSRSASSWRSCISN